jgi:tellurite resistance protein
MMNSTLAFAQYIFIAQKLGPLEMPNDSSLRHSMRLPLVPAAFFGIVLGLGGLGNAWRSASVLWNILPPFIGEVINFAAIVVWAIVCVLYAIKWLMVPDQALTEAEHPVQCCFIGLAGVSTMLIALAVLPYSTIAAWMLYLAGAAFTLLFALWRTGRLWHGARDASTTTAVLYLPTVAGSFMTAIGASALGHPDWGQLAFGAGFFSWLAIESVLLHRLLTAPEMVAPLRPSMGIQLAPPAVGCVAYLSVTTGTPDILAHAMLGYAILQTMLLLRLLPWILRQPFAASYWGATFGATALAAAAVRMVGRGDVGAVQTLAPVLFLFANIVVGIIAAGTFYLLIRGKLLPAAPPVQTAAPS